ncbi:MAG: hypothetical protein IH973_09315 [Myxococcales bacterium]|nr:hypothetical protein [Myxococcales bacterium]
MVVAGKAVVIVTADDTKLRRTLKGSGNSVRAFAKVAIIALAGIGLIQFFRSAVQEAIKFENAMRGLSSVSKALGVNMGAANQAAEELAKDGLLSVNEAAEGLKNLLATGFGLPVSP